MAEAFPPFIRAATVLPILIAFLPVHSADSPIATNWDVFEHIKTPDLPLDSPADPILANSISRASAMLARHQPARTRSDWKSRRPEVMRAFRKAIGLELFPDRTPLNPRITSHHEFPGYRVENVLFDSRPGFAVSGNLYLPSVAERKRCPAILSPIGHFLTPGKTATDVQSRCIHLAQLGFVVLAYDAIGQGERMTPGNIHHDAGYALLPLGETIAGWMVWDSIRAVDYLISRPEVDGDRLGITGNSGGGLNTLFTAALDDRLKAAAIVGFTFDFSNWANYAGSHCTCTHLPGLFREVEWSEVAALIAPRAVLMIQGANDGIFPVSGARKSGHEVERIYQMLSVRDRAKFVELSGLPHSYSRPFREVMYDWMLRHLMERNLQGQGVEPPLETLPQNDPRLLCDPEHNSIRPGSTVTDMARARAALLTKDNIDARRDDARRRQIIKWVNTVTEVPPGSPHFLAPRRGTAQPVAGGTLEKVHFNSEDGVRLPGLLWRPLQPDSRKPAVIVVHDQGKSVVANSAIFQPMLDAGHLVLAVDLRGRGETLGWHGPRHNTNFRLVANQILMGEPLAGRRAYDLRRSIDFLGEQQLLGEAGVVVVAVGEDALPATLATITDARVRHLAVAGFDATFASQLRSRGPIEVTKLGEAWNDPQLDGRIRDREFDFDLGSVLPGVLRICDLPELYALVSPRKVLFMEPRSATETTDSTRNNVAGQALISQPNQKWRGVRIKEWIAQQIE